LALQLFDSATRKKLFTLSDWERELLGYAAYLHDVGDFISFNNHHLHSHYIISNAEVLGFDQREIAIMANVSKFHRKRVPRKSDPDLEGMDAHSQKVVVVLSTLLRVAESLDRSHTGLIVGAEFVRVEKDRAVLRIRSKQECQLECWGVESDNRAFERAFDRTIQIEVAIEPAD
jgi:exopolyphosphatase/guanosine-5'-triphosphate,3'-diphosphate pyrophosphatase